MQYENMEIVCDVQATQMYRDIYNAPCDCRECKYFMEHFPKSYPEVCACLKQFGITLDLPLEIMDLGFLSSVEQREYCVYYCVKGELSVPRIQSRVGEANLTLRNWTVAGEAYANTGMEPPYFIVEVSNLALKDVKGALSEALQIGREIEFSYREKNYFISHNQDTDWYVYCQETKQMQHFPSAEALLQSARLENENINRLWDAIQIDYIL